MSEKTFVIEKECRHCGAPMGGGVCGVGKALKGDEFGPRNLTISETPVRFVELAERANPDIAIKRYGTCSDCYEG